MKKIRSKFSNEMVIKSGRKGYPVSLPTHTTRAQLWERGNRIIEYPIPEKKAKILINIEKKIPALTTKQYLINLAKEVYKTNPKKRIQFIREHSSMIEYISHQFKDELELLNQELKNKSSKAKKQILSKKGLKVKSLEYDKNGKITHYYLENKSKEAQEILKEDKKKTDIEYYNEIISELKRDLAYYSKLREDAKKFQKLTKKLKKNAKTN